MALPLTTLRIASHVLVFLLAVVVFYLGLGVGLSQNPLWGHPAVAGRRGDWRPEREVDAKSPPLAPVGSSSTARPLACPSQTLL